MLGAIASILIPQKAVKTNLGDNQHKQIILDHLGAGYKFNDQGKLVGPNDEIVPCLDPAIDATSHRFDYFLGSDGVVYGIERSSIDHRHIFIRSNRRPKSYSDIYEYVSAKVQTEINICNKVGSLYAFQGGPSKRQIIKYKDEKYQEIVWKSPTYHTFYLQDDGIFGGHGNSREKIMKLSGTILDPTESLRERASVMQTKALSFLYGHPYQIVPLHSDGRGTIEHSYDKLKFKLMWKTTTELGEYQMLDVRNGELWGTKMTGETVRIVNKDKTPVRYESFGVIILIIVGIAALTVVGKIISSASVSFASIPRSILVGAMIISAILNAQQKGDLLDEIGRQIKKSAKANTKGYFQKMLVGFATEMAVQQLFEAKDFNLIFIRIILVFPCQNLRSDEGMLWICAFGQFIYITDYKIPK